jgi:hypothetical protein
MLDDIPATTAQIARHLGIKESTLKTYRRTGQAPRPVMLALFWETQWGRSAADTEAHNAVTVHQGQAQRLQEHQGRMAGIIWGLQMELDRHQDARPANIPIFNVG